MRLFPRLRLLGLTLALAAPAALAQGAPDAEDGPGLRFNGLGRTLIQQSDLGGPLADADTASAESLADGNFVLDLAVNAQPNRVTEVQGVIRLRNELGGFFGAGATVEIRELWARGVIADAVRYRLGDMDLALTPYTLFLPDEDGVVNEPELFAPQREIIDYEEFYTGENTRRLQGGTADFALAFDRGVDEIETRVMLARLRGTDFSETPTRLITGGRVGATSAPIGPGTQLRTGFNLSHVWDDLQSGNANEGIRNTVYSFDGDLTLLRSPGYSVHLRGEAGHSFVDRRERTERMSPTDSLRRVVTTEQLVRDSDTFFEIGLAAAFPSQDLDVSATFVDVGPDFFNVAAQTKRVDYTPRELDTFNRFGNDRERRDVGLFDLTRDPGVYTFRMEDQLVAYDPRYSNVLPYGRATPNRRGVRLGAEYGRDGGVEAMLDLALLREIRGQGTTELKDFVLLRAGTDVPIGALAGLGRGLDLTLGAQYEDTSRGGGEFETVDLTSVLFEAGLTAEIYTRLDVLLGAKTRSSDGRDYVPTLVNFNDVETFPDAFVTDDGESLIGAGLRYRFKDDVYLTVQVQSYRYGRDDAPEDDYRIGQVFALYSMTF